MVSGSAWGRGLLQPGGHGILTLVSTERGRCQALPCSPLAGDLLLMSLV